MDDISLDEWLDETKKHLDEFAAMVRKDQSGCDPEYPMTAFRGDWDEWFMMFEGSSA